MTMDGSVRSSTSASCRMEMISCACAGITAVGYRDNYCRPLGRP